MNNHGFCEVIVAVANMLRSIVDLLIKEGSQRENLEKYIDKHVLIRVRTSVNSVLFHPLIILKEVNTGRKRKLKEKGPEHRQN